MFPQLTTGAIDRILNGEDVANAVLQILVCKKIPETVNDHYRLLISDGVGYTLAYLGTRLNHMAENKELEKFTIVRVEKCVCNQILQADEKVIILFNLTVLVPGIEVNEKLGNPVRSSSGGASKDVTNNASAVNNVAKPGYSNLKTSAINQILNGENVTNAVIQILDCRKIPGCLGDRYRLLISDGVTGCPFVMLGIHLNQMVANKELEKFTIVRVDECVCNQVRADRKVIILMNLTVLVPGNKVNETFGNPVISYVVNTSEGATNNAPDANGIATSSCSNLNIGSIKRILNGEEVRNPVVQLLGCERLPGVRSNSLGCKSMRGPDSYRLQISDGITGYPSAMLGTELNHMVEELKKFSILRLDKWTCNGVEESSKVIIILGITVLVPGNEVNEKFGKPVNSSCNVVHT